MYSSKGSTQSTAVTMQLLRSWNKEEIPEVLKEFLLVENTALGRWDKTVFPGLADLKSDSNGCLVKCGEMCDVALRCEL